ncbi:hypothetical protein [Paraburkholderia youngii]|uniref:hypothetical protein n=1 Tax=Paraburkholderia youngii TaxID=2782701 RepID=UPI003D227D54
MSWNLAARLTGKHIGLLGDKLSGLLSTIDPQASVEVGREQIQEGLREAALKKADAQQKYDAARKAREDLAANIDADKARAQKLAAKLATNEVSEEMVTKFADDLEASLARLPQLQADEDDAKHYLETVQQILDAFTKKLEDFDRDAAAATRTLAQAKADQQHAEMRMDNQRELQQLASGTGGPSNALDALKAAANKTRLQADATQTLADIGDKQTRQQDAVAEARRIADGDSTAGESMQDRLKRLSGG